MSNSWGHDSGGPKEAANAPCKAASSVRRVLLVLAGVALALLAYWAISYQSTPSARLALPDSASEVREWISSDGHLSDHVYLMRAKMPVDDFPAYARRLGLRPLEHVEARWRDRIGWGPYSEPSWWSPTTEVAGTMVKTYSNGLIMAKHESGTLYVLSFAE